MSQRFTLGQNERLKSRKQIEKLFSEGKKFTMAPFRIYYLYSDDKTIPLRFGAGVSNKNFKKAVDRNRIKRLTKETYRLQKLILQQKIKEQKKSLNIFFIYTSRDLPEYKIISDVMEKILDKLCHIIDSGK